MKKKIARELVEQAARSLQLVNIHMVYNENYYNLIPLQTSHKLFLAIEEDDFLFDGFRICRFRDVQTVRIKDDKCDEIIRKEGLLVDFCTPSINLESWQTVFECLRETGQNIIVQYETPEGEDDNFTIGSIQRVYKRCVYMYNFDADGIWDPDPYRIPYSEVTSVTFGSRYINVFSKYISPAPTL